MRTGKRFGSRMRSIVVASLFGLMAGTAVAQDWSKEATISATGYMQMFGRRALEMWSGSVI